MSVGQYFFEAFDNMERLGPGSDTSSMRAMAFVPNPKEEIHILDIGCGVGTHSLLLAEYFPNAVVTAIDNHEPYITKLNAKAEKRGLSQRVHGICMSMFDMNFSEGSFDLIWSEGAIYIAGFQRGLSEWKKFLKPGGYLICSEISWLNENPSKESHDFWTAGYPEIDTIPNKRKVAENLGYRVAGYRICIKSDWTDNYYKYLEKNIRVMKEKYPENEEVLEVIESLQTEIDIFNRNSDDYSYVFYILVKEKEPVLP